MRPFPPSVSPAPVLRQAQGPQLGGTGGQRLRTRGSLKRVAFGTGKGGELIPQVTYLKKKKKRKRKNGYILLLSGLDIKALQSG